MTDKAIKEQIDALRSVTSKALHSKAASKRLLDNLAKFTTSSPKLTSKPARKGK